MLALNASPNNNKPLLHFINSATRAFGDFIMLIKLLTKVFGSRNDRTLRRMRKVVNIINAMEPEMENSPTKN